MGISLSLITIIALLVANGFFVAAEFALVKARNFRIESLANEGSRTAQLTLRIQSNIEAYLAACQLGITMASLGLGWVGEPTIAAIIEPFFSWLGMPKQLIHISAFLIGFIIFSSLHIVVGEQFPKTLAIRKPEPVSLWVAYPLHLSYLAVWPLNWLLNKATNIILSWFKIPQATHAEVFSSEEIQGLVATSKEHGEIHHEKAQMLHNLFEFDQRQVGRVMIPQHAVHILDVAASADDNLKIIRETEHSRFPLIDTNNDEAIVGIILAKDLYRALLEGKKEPWKELSKFARDPLVVPETQRVSLLFELMRTQKAHLALVIDEYGTFVGIVSMEDLLEEIVGEIHDETDEESTEIDLKQISENEWEADGLVSLNDVERLTDLKVSYEIDANTLSGLFLHHLERIPEKGDEIQEGDYHLKILEIDDRRVGRVKIKKIAGSDNK